VSSAASAGPTVHNYGNPNPPRPRTRGIPRFGRAAGGVLP